MNKLGRELEMTTVKKDLLTIGIVGFLLFMLGNWAIAITDPVESNYTLTAVEMLRSGDYISPRIYGNYWYDKPAFFYWDDDLWLCPKAL